MFFTSPASRITELPTPLAVCCHDAGAANLIAAWLATRPRSEYRLCARGPAAAIFAAALGTDSFFEIEDALAGASCVLTGSGWSSHLEHRARSLARDKQVFSIAVLDHWVNYRMRFERDGIEVLPDAFIVTDTEALAIATAEFGSQRPVWVWSNDYLSGEVSRIQELSARSPTHSQTNLLVVLEPVRAAWGEPSGELPEFEALDYFMNRLAHDPELAEARLRLRPHPSESAAKYAPWIAKRSDERICVSPASSLAEDIAWADVVAGLNSYALVVARESGRRSISYLPPHAPPCVLRHSGIERLNRSAGKFL